MRKVKSRWVERTEWLKLNVGGRIFETTRATLTSHPSSSLARMFEPNSALPPSLMEDGVYQVNMISDILLGDMKTLLWHEDIMLVCESSMQWIHCWYLWESVDQVDACPRAFAVILNWLRYRQLMLGNIGAEEVSLAGMCFTTNVCLNNACE